MAAGRRSRAFAESFVQYSLACFRMHKDPWPALILSPRSPSVEEEAASGSGGYSIPPSAAAFTYIHKNEYTRSSHASLVLQQTALPCECTPQPGACGESSACINRLLLMECNEDCPARRFCANKRIQMLQYARGIEVQERPGKGCGLTAASSIPRHSLIMEYVGEVLSPAAMARRIERQAMQHFYFMTLGPEQVFSLFSLEIPLTIPATATADGTLDQANPQVIDASEKGNVSRFMNHSCNPNCETQKWIVGRELRIGLFAIRDIAPGDELTFDYKFECFGRDKAQACLCGEACCKGVIGTARRSAPSSSSGEEEEEGAREVGRPRPSPKLSKRTASVRGLEDPLLVADLTKCLIVSTDKGRLCSKLRLLHATTSPVCLKWFLMLHGLKICGALLRQHLEEPSIVRYILSILEKCPLSCRNGLEDSGLERLVEQLRDHADGTIRALSGSLLGTWGSLPRVYRIPKRTLSDIASDVEAAGCGQRGQQESPSSRTAPHDDMFGHLLANAAEVRKPRPQQLPLERPELPRQRIPQRPPSPRGSCSPAASPALECPSVPSAAAKGDGISDKDLADAIARAREAAAAQTRSPLESPDLGSANKAVWIRLLKLPVSEVVTRTMSRFKDQVDMDFFKATCRKITHICIEKESSKRAAASETAAFSLPEKESKKIKHFVLDYMKRLGYKCQ